MKNYTFLKNCVLAVACDLFFCISQVAVNSPPGIWICSTDMMLGIPPETGKI